MANATASEERVPWVMPNCVIYPCALLINSFHIIFVLEITMMLLPLSCMELNENVTVAVELQDHVKPIKVTLCLARIQYSTRQKVSSGYNLVLRSCWRSQCRRPTPGVPAGVGSINF
jgi:hypothetical protein